MSLPQEDPEVIIEIGRDGKVTFDKKKFTSDQCLEAFSDLEKSLGEKVAENKKAEAFQKQAKRISFQGNKRSN